MGRLDQRKRDTNKRKRKSVVVIACEGNNETETNYFSNFSSRSCNIKFSTGHHTDPLGMVKDLINYMKKEDIKAEYGDKIYLLIDTDVNQNKQKQIDEVKIKCIKNGIELITSTPTFEYWYILHYQYTTKNYRDSKQVKTELKSLIPNYSESLDIYSIIKDKTDIAIKNSKKVEKYQSSSGNSIDSDNANPHSSVYRVVEELRKRGSEDT